MKGILTLISAMLCFSFCSAQKIESEKVFGGYKFTQEGKILNMPNLVQKLKPNTESFQLINKAKSSNSIATVLGFAGGALVGWPIGSAIGGGEPKWALAGAGVGLIIIAIPISSSATKNAKKAVDLYNSNLAIGYYDSPEFNYKIVINENGTGIAIQF